jgi:hypothetical protein
MSVAKHFRVVGYIICQDYIDSRDAIKGIATLFPKKVAASIQECKFFLYCFHLILLYHTDLDRNLI